MPLSNDDGCKMRAVQSKVQTGKNPPKFCWRKLGCLRRCDFLGDSHKRIVGSRAIRSVELGCSDMLRVVFVLVIHDGEVTLHDSLLHVWPLVLPAELVPTISVSVVAIAAGFLEGEGVVLVVQDKAKGIVGQNTPKNDR